MQGVWQEEENKNGTMPQLFRPHMTWNGKEVIQYSDGRLRSDSWTRLDQINVGSVGSVVAENKGEVADGIAST